MSDQKEMVEITREELERLKEKAGDGIKYDDQWESSQGPSTSGHGLSAEQQQTVEITREELEALKDAGGADLSYSDTWPGSQGPSTTR